MHCFVNHPVKMIVPRYSSGYSFAKCVFYIATLVAAISMQRPERESTHIGMSDREAPSCVVRR
jgi:hypothetical protein